uniref:DH domain-containing protein n=1 Tax=Macrostomum lignano TaxID=282301 RepID=A0A1I8H4B6_9PLAT
PQNFIGDAKSPDRSPNESGGEDNEEDGKRRRSSLELSVEVLPRVDILKEKSKKILKKQNTVADLTQKTLQSFATFDENSKKRGSGMSILKLIDKKRNKGRDSGAELHDIFSRPETNLHWKDLFDKPDLESEAACAARSKEASSSPSRVDSRFADLPEKERLRREAVWELFKSELVFLIDYLMVLKHCFLEPLKKLQVDGHLMFVEPEDLFGNIDELCYRCEVDPRCHRLQITDLLVAPMQHCTKMPLLLAQIRKYTSEDCNKAMLTESLKRVENSLKSLEDKLKWLRNFERLQNIQQQLIWPPITELETKAFIPDFLKSSLSCQPCEKLIAQSESDNSFTRDCSASLTNRSTEVYCFLFDDILLLTKVKKPPKKRSVNESSSVYSMSPTDGALFVVYRQPIALDRFSIHDIGYVEANANGLKHAFVLIHISRFQQIIGVYTLQSAGDQQKLAWLDSLRQSQQRFQEKLKCKLAMTVAANSPRTNTHRRLMSKMQRMQMREQQRQRHQQQQQPARRRSGGSGKDVPISASASKAGIESSNCEDINEEDENEDDAKTDLLDDDDDDDYEDDDDADDATGDDVDEDEGDDESDGPAALSTEDVVRHRKHRQ